MNSKGYPAELGKIVKDLWALRLPLIHEKLASHLRPDDDDDDDDDGDSANHIRLYDSQTDEDDRSSDRANKKDRVTERAAPSLVDSLGLCYIGMIVLRQPTSLGDLYRLVVLYLEGYTSDKIRWACNEELPFFRPLRLIPIEIRQKLPVKYTNALETIVSTNDRSLVTY